MARRKVKAEPIGMPLSPEELAIQAELKALSVPPVVTDAVGQENIHTVSILGHNEAFLTVLNGEDWVGGLSWRDALLLARYKVMGLLDEGQTVRVKVLDDPEVVYQHKDVAEKAFAVLYPELSGQPVEQSERATYEALLAALLKERDKRVKALAEIDEAIASNRAILEKDDKAKQEAAKAERQAALEAYIARPKFQAVMAEAWAKAGANKTVTDKGYSAQLQLDATLFVHPLSKPAAQAWVKAKSEACNIKLAESGKTISIGLVFVTPKAEK